MTTGAADHIAYSVDVVGGLARQWALRIRRPIRACRCGEPTTQMMGDCDACTGCIRPVCRVCGVDAPHADWAACDTPHDHMVGDEVCGGSRLPVTILN